MPVAGEPARREEERRGDCLWYGTRWFAAPWTRRWRDETRSSMLELVRRRYLIKEAINGARSQRCDGGRKNLLYENLLYTKYSK